MTATEVVERDLLRILRDGPAWRVELHPDCTGPTRAAAAEAYCRRYGLAFDPVPAPPEPPSGPAAPGVQLGLF